jgi:hypothetical protein
MSPVLAELILQPFSEENIGREIKGDGAEPTRAGASLFAARR